MYFRVRMKIRNSKTFYKRFGIAALIAAVFCVLVISACAITRKINAAEILSKTKLEFAALSLDAVALNKDLFPQKSLGGGFLPNPQVIALVQDFSKGILEKEIGKAGLTATLTADNQSTDTLWIKTISATIKLDSILDLPIELKDSLMLVPGKSKLSIFTQMPIDKRLFKIKDVQTIQMAGKLEATLDADGEIVELNFVIDKKISDEEKQALAEKARTSVLNSIVNDWVGAILPQD